MRHMEDEQVCGTCKYNKADWSNGHFCGFVCNNGDSDAYGLETAYSDGCEEWESKDY